MRSPARDPRKTSNLRRWLLRFFLAFTLAWLFAHLVTLGSPHWGPGNRHDATVSGQMIAIAGYPLLFLIIFGTDRLLKGILIALGACVIAATGLFIYI